jgi:hypothetical protein
MAGKRFTEASGLYKLSAIMKRITIGSTTLDKKWCPNCDDYSLVNPSEKQCYCGTEFTIEKVTESKIIGGQRRRRKSPAVKSLAKKTDNKCYWCGRVIIPAQPILVRGKLRYNKGVVDHRIPYGFCNANTDLVASCARCNSYKSNKIMSEDSMRDYLQSRWDNDIKSGKVDEHG